MFYHSLVSEWNHGNAHFLRGVVRVLQAQGHDVSVYEPADGWSRQNLLEQEGHEAIRRFREAFPGMMSRLYEPARLNLGEALAGADLVLVHEWNDPGLVAAIGRHHGQHDSYALLFHDTHHRSVSRPAEISRYDLSNYDGVLAFGRAVQAAYMAHGWARRAWVWHEAADVEMYRPLEREKEADVIWIGNWGDGERAAELESFLVEPVRRIGARATVCGVRYPDEALSLLRSAGIQFHGWAGASEVVEQYARHLLTVHVPRRFYAEALPGIPTIRVFEALACGIPLICAPWRDAEGLFAPGEDYLVARDEREMTAHMSTLLRDESRRQALSRQGRETILARHTCAHRVGELMEICEELGVETKPQTAHDTGIILEGSTVRLEQRT